jgi:hypothetical protein
MPKSLFDRLSVADFGLRHSFAHCSRVLGKASPIDQPKNNCRFLHYPFPFGFAQGQGPVEMTVLEGMSRDWVELRTMGRLGVSREKSSRRSFRYASG